MAAAVTDLFSERRGLEREALTAARLRGHDLHGFVQDSDRPLLAVAYCRRCGRGAYVNARPRPTEIDIHGEAVAVTCDGRRF